MTGASAAEHWRRAYESRAPDETSWFEAEPVASLKLIAEAGPAPGAPIVDVGGGASRLAGALLRRGHTDLTVVDIAPGALERARTELGKDADRVEWVLADVRDHDFGREFAIWHDRALLHFMVDVGDRDAYLATLRRSLASGGQAVIATFDPDGPERCSGLAVRRYGAQDLARLLGGDFALESSREVVHRTPLGAEQRFCYARLRRR